MPAGRRRPGAARGRRRSAGSCSGSIPSSWCLLCFAARAVVAVLSLHQGGAVRPCRRGRRCIPCSNFFKFRNHSDDTRAYSKDIGIELEEPEKLKISLK